MHILDEHTRNQRFPRSGSHDRNHILPDSLVEDFVLVRSWDRVRDGGGVHGGARSSGAEKERGNEPDFAVCRVSCAEEVVVLLIRLHPWICGAVCRSL